MGQKRELGGETVLLKDGFNLAEILPGTDQSFPEFFLDAPLGADVPTQLSQELGRRRVAVRFKKADDFLVRFCELLRVETVSSYLPKEPLEFFLLFAQYFSLAFVLDAVVTNSPGKPDHLVNQANIVLVMDQDFSVPVLGKDCLPELDFVCKALGRERAGDLIQGERTGTQEA